MIREGCRKVKLDKEKFYLELNSVFADLNLNKKLIEKVKTDLSIRNILPQAVQGIINRSIPVQTVDMPVLYFILDSLNKEVQEINKEEKIIEIDLKRLNPETYFTEQEIKEMETYKREIKKGAKYPLVFEQVLKIADDQYLTKLSLQEIENLFNNNLIYYNTATQRNPKIREWKNKIIQTANVNNQSVKEIQEDFEKELFIPNCLTFNLLQNGEDEYSYDEQNLRLTIYSGEIDANDGYHRDLGILAALKNRPNLKLNMGIMITNFDENKAKRQIKQEDKKNPMDKRYIQSLDDKLANQVVKKLNESPESDLKGKITTDTIMLRHNNAFTYFNILSDAIEYNFDIKTRKDVFDISKWLIECFSELIGSYPEQFIDNIGESKKYSTIVHENMFIGYIALFAKLQHDNNWQEKLIEVMKKMDFSIQNPTWNEINLFTKSVNKTTIKKISNYFQQ
jgi:hypothetical protein